MEYLVSYGRSGDFGRFQPAQPLACRRGDRVVVRGERGPEIGEVLCTASAGHDRYLSRTATGELLRLATAEDEQTCRRLAERGDQVFARARTLAAEMSLPLEVVDVEMLLDGRQAIVYHLRRNDCDYRPLVSTLSKAFEVLIVMQNLALPAELAEGGEGCGRPDCGKKDGGCDSCGSGGCGTCGKGTKPDDVARYLAGLRETIDTVRTNLL